VTPPGDSEREPLLVFVHIPKTAGTTVRSIIRTNEPGERNRRPGANVFQGGGGVVTRALEKLREEARSLDLDGVRILHGHNPLGIREYLEPAFPDREFRYFTFLRDPIDRSLSHFFRLRDRPAVLENDEPEDNEEDVPQLPENATFEEALEAGYLHDNLQTRMLSGDPEPFGEVTTETLEQAKRNVREVLTVVGITERLDESLVLARQRLGWRSVLYYPGHRVNRSRPRGKEVPEELRRAAERANRYDAELYRFALEQFEQAPERDELEFHVELAALSAAKAADNGALDVPAPPMFNGGEREWRLLLATHSQLVLLRHEAGRRDVRTARLGPQEDQVDQEESTPRRRRRRPKHRRKRIRAAQSLLRSPPDQR
jgi:hypothetical protein